jgi:hypothetical protein
LRKEGSVEEDEIRKRKQKEREEKKEEERKRTGENGGRGEQNIHRGYMENIYRKIEK